MRSGGAYLCWMQETVEGIGVVGEVQKVSNKANMFAPFAQFARRLAQICLRSCYDQKIESH
jgi:hypothetical protein